MDTGRTKSYLGLFFISMSLLMVEIVFTRTARIAFGYAYQLLIISLAISGIGLGGVPVFIFLRRKAEMVDRVLLPASLLYTIVIPIPFLIVHNLGTGQSLTALDLTTLLKFLVSVFLVYLFGGACIATMFSYLNKSISIVYFVDLIGSAVGAFLVVPLLDLLRFEMTVVSISVVASISVLLFALHAHLKRAYLIGLTALAVLSVLILGFYSADLKVSADSPDLMFSTSNSFSQVDVYRTTPLKAARELSQAYFNANVPDVAAYEILYDRIGKTNAIDVSRLSDAEYLSRDLVFFPFFLKPASNVLLFGTGGGMDVIRAQLAGSKRITAVEINPLIIDVARDKANSRVYDASNVRLVIGEGRNFIASDNEKYDLVFLPQARGFGGRGANTHHDPENYLNTKEAYVSYLDHLSVDGILAVSHNSWLLNEFARVGMLALKEKGIEIRGHTALVEGRSFSVVMFKPNGFTQDEKQTIKKNASRLRFKASFPDSSSLASNQSADVTDDKPFIWDKPMIMNIFNEDYLNTMTTLGRSKNEGERLLTLRFLVWLLIFGLLSCLLLIIPPPFFKKIRDKKLSTQVLYLLSYFMFLGIGFIAFELVIVQRSFVFLAHPTYSVAIVLSSFLLFGSLGSLVTQRVRPARFKISVIVAIAGLFLLLVGYSLLMNCIFTDLLFLKLAYRIPISIIMLSLPCFLAGMLFPIGLKATNQIDRGLIPWMWSINGMATVLGGAIVALLSFFMGFRLALSFAALCYLAALLLFSRVRLVINTT